RGGTCSPGSTVATILRVGTRASALALRQTHAILHMLRARQPHLQAEIVEISTHGDRFQNTPITHMGNELERGIFNSALEQALLEERVDVATCSFKDVESSLPPGVVAVSVGPREDPRDVLISRHGLPLERLPRDAVLATSSPRRVSQLAAFRADLRFEPLRGNVNTRVLKDPERFDGVVLAAAGVRRLDLAAHITQVIPEQVLLPAPAQGALGCQYLAQRQDVAALVGSIQDQETETCVRLEKALLVRMSGGCFAPVGVLAQMQEGRLVVRCRIAALNGRVVLEDQEQGAPANGPAMVDVLARRLLERGAGQLIEASRQAMEGAARDAPEP
ncbi:MAG TPA: hydroxymethylbilane synthase, partial [bacterium]|nr:hydroxymethylbilane synthase [bacterium]